MAYTNTYTSVTWTVGDIITEAKMDNMVSNDSAYDSHTSSGFQLDNNVGYSQKNAAGTRKVIANLNASDELHVGVNDENDHTVINAGSSKLVKIKVLRQNNTSDSYEENTVFLHGWGYIQGDGAEIFITESVSFGITFSAAPIVYSAYVGRDTSAPSAIGDFDLILNTGARMMIPGTSDSTTTGFNIYLMTADQSTSNASFYYGYGWIAIGELN